MKNTYKLTFLITLAFLLSGCQAPPIADGRANGTGNTSSLAGETARVPSIEVTPLKAGEGNYKVIAADRFKITVSAPGAQETTLLYQPVTASDDRLIKLKT